MPSTAQSGSGTAYEPSEYADEFSTDPAKDLSKNTETVVAIVNGTNDFDLLDAYLQVELDRQKRSDVIGAINERKQTVQTCPRGCDAPVMDRFETANGFQIKHQNAIQYKTCVTLAETEAGSKKMVVIFHDDPEEQVSNEPEDSPSEREPPAETEPESSDDAATEPVEAESDDADADTDDDSEDTAADEPVGQRPKQLYHKMKTVDGSMNLAGIRGWAASELGLSPDETKHVVDSLESGGYIEEIEEGTYRCQEKGGE